ncbi:MAG: hypothetical protein N3B10_00395 [Armatimonadetes bacterium]|nr:hypothetical protein [Armatimonadota bacterium]MCX7966928.1 hypothetical protein [Armatimonadota bacterium]MDW8144401.1 hypothetical protein [Armatimonadota bacterium]
MGRKSKDADQPEIKTAAMVKLELITHMFMSGQIPFETYWQAKRKLEPEAKREYEEIKRWAVEEAKLVTMEEWDELRQNYRDEYGDSFVHYMNALRHKAVFVTNNPKILADRRKLQKRFGGKIISGEQFQKKSGEAAKSALDQLMSELLGRPRPA